MALKPGIYFDLDADTYHKDPAISKTNMTNLIMGSDLDCWENSHFLNPGHIEDKSPSMEKGTLIDTLLFDRKLFDEKCYVMGHSRMGDTRKGIKLNEYNDAMRAINLLYTVPYTQKLLTGGYSQISIFWLDEETGLMFKTRPDHGNIVKTCFMLADYKSIRELHDSTISYQLCDYGYAIQGALGVVGFEKLREMAREKTPFIIQGTKEQKAWFKQALQTTSTRFQFIFQRSSFPFPFKNINLDDDVLNIAWKWVRKASKRYKFNLDTYGLNRWPGGENKSTTIGIFQMSKKFSTMAEE